MPKTDKTDKTKNTELDRILEKELKRAGEKNADAGETEDEGSGSYEQTLKLCGIGLNEAENLAADLLKGENPALTIEDRDGEVHIHVSALPDGEKSAKKLAKRVIKELKSRFSEKIYTTEDTVTLEQTVYELLRSNSLTVTTAESCTGGLVAARLINVPGASEVFKEGFITYSNKAKRTRLGVKKSTLLKHGAVSEQTVKEMTKGALFTSRADVAVAVSGVAGPDGGNEEKPVGTVFVGCNIRGKIEVCEYHFDGDRNEVRQKTVTAALSLLRRCMLKLYSENNFR
ncbi:MAG: nicotinamide-nucleotide amidohydrolase family protein [Lachnospiraceae bacterium]|nr:nicotinamide-nucleotide amidohydrolase family protein [Lachnospiraceae bacterium]